jgi:threonine synthase
MKSVLLYMQSEPKYAELIEQYIDESATGSSGSKKRTAAHKPSPPTTTTATNAMMISKSSSMKSTAFDWMELVGVGLHDEVDMHDQDQIQQQQQQDNCVTSSSSSDNCIQTFRRVAKKKIKFDPSQ